jgi:hypothetical protein
MSSIDHMRAAHWHMKQCVRSIRKALTLVGRDPGGDDLDDDSTLDAEPNGYPADPDPLPNPRAGWRVY